MLDDLESILIQVDVYMKVDVEESVTIAKAEGIRTVPAFKIYKNGEKLIEMIRPSHQFLEDSVRNCILQQTLPAPSHGPNLYNV